MKSKGLKERGRGSRVAVAAAADGDGTRMGSAGDKPGEKYDRILDAAVDVIAEKGYFHSPVSAIAARAGVADGTVYLYFKSKDDVLRTVMDRIVGQFMRAVEMRFRTLTGAREQLEFIAALHLGAAASNRNVAILMQTEMRQSAQFIKDFSHEHLVKYIATVRGVVRRGQEEGLFRKDISDGVVAHCLFGAIDELLTAAVFTSRTFDAKLTAAQVVDVVVNGIGLRRNMDETTERGTR